MGEWEKAEKFDFLYGLAKVTDKNGMTYLLNTEGRIYSSEDEVQRLDLSHKEIENLSSDIGKFTNLEELLLNNNKLTMLPVEIGQLKRLKRLDLQNNQLASLPVELGNLTNLEELYLGWNKLTKFPTNIMQLENLKILDLRSNQLRSLPIEIGQLKKAKKLDLGSNYNLENLSQEMVNLSLEPFYYDFYYDDRFDETFFSNVKKIYEKTQYDGDRTNFRDNYEFSLFILIFLHIVIVACLNGISYFDKKKRYLLKWLCQFILCTIIILLFVYYELTIWTSSYLYLTSSYLEENGAIFVVLIHIGIILGILGGILSHHKKYNSFKLICWIIAGIMVCRVSVANILCVVDGFYWYFKNGDDLLKNSVAVYSLGLIPSIIGGIIFMCKQNHIYQWLCWGIAIECMLIFGVFLTI